MTVSWLNAGDIEIGPDRRPSNRRRPIWNGFAFSVPVNRSGSRPTISGDR